MAALDLKRSGPLVDLSTVGRRRSELEFALECCRCSFASADEERLARLAAAVDWPRLVGLLRFHRIEGLAYAGLRLVRECIPRNFFCALEADALGIVAANLRRLAEAAKLQSSLREAGVRTLFVKGLTLGSLAYENPLLKDGRDIDVLVSEHDLEAAAGILEKCGYSLAIPANRDLRKWHASHKESLWSRSADGLDVDLHTRLADNPNLIPGIGVDSPAREVQVASGHSFATLPNDLLMAYLFVHGASSFWFRLKWITDVAAMLHRMAPAEIERLYDRSVCLHAGRAAALALLHADDLYGSLRRTGLRQRLEGDRVSRSLAVHALRQIASASLAEPTERFLGTFRIHASQLFLLPGVGFKIGELVRQVDAARH